MNTAWFKKLAIVMLSATRPVIGGQAVMEGVMMRSPKSFAVAVRRPDGRIVLREKQWLSFSEKFPFLKWPLLRGATMLVESMYNGMSALQFSAEQVMQAENEDNKLGVHQEPKKEGVDKALMLTMLGSMVLGILLFKAVPHFVAYGLGILFGHDGQSALPITSIGFHLVDGIVKMGIFVGYILMISMFNDVKRLFMYHGAEHKTVHAWEKALPLDVESAKIQSTAHPRCGTSLILLVISVSILIFAFTLPFMPVISDSPLVQSLFSLAIKVPLMLPIAGVAYEFQRGAAKNPNNQLIKLFIAPGMLMQRLTTREPTDDQLEVALTALRKAVWREQFVQENVVLLQAMSYVPSQELEVFDSFADVQARVA